MGTKMAPSYANIFTGRLEKQLLQSVSLKPFSWLRFIDDINMKWTHGRETLEEFITGANNFHPTIKFTAEVSNDKHVFLDTTPHLEGDRVVLDRYTKPTDSHQYLLPSSCHPPFAVRTSPTLLRYASDAFADDQAFEMRVKDVSDQLSKRGYHTQSID